MFILDRSKNDTSITLDLVRAFAAQIVCIGHALNFANGASITFAPNVGVLIFFVLSGFVIAHTLVTKATSPEYGLAAFGIERFSRIYTAYLPAILMIAACDYAMQYLGHPLPGDPTDLRTLLGNLTMRQGLPGTWGVSTFGSAGQLTSVAVEFHIYFFVGAIFFLLKARSVLFCLIVAMFFSTMPLGYFSNIPETDRALFVLWLAGFASYFVARSVSVGGNQAILGAAAFVGLVWYWAAHRTPNDYDLSFSRFSCTGDFDVSGPSRRKEPVPIDPLCSRLLIFSFSHSSDHRETGAGNSSLETRRDNLGSTPGQCNCDTFFLRF
jgi:peptidoglycan/LPS O-acetylase OafA/YrhL